MSELQEASKEPSGQFYGRKVCMVAPFLPKIGGMTVQVQMMVDGLECEGAQVFRVDTILHKLDNKLFFALRIILQPFVTAFRLLRSAPQSDVVHIHAASWWGFVPVMVCAPLNRLFIHKRLIISFHGGSASIWLKRYSKLVLPFFSMADKIIVVSPKLQDTFQEYGIKTSFLRNLVDLDVFQFRKRTKIMPNIVWIRHLEETYDPVTALRIFERIRAEIPDAQIVFIGDGSLRPTMENYIYEHALEGVHFRGRLPHADVAREFDKADIFLNTSINDGMPTALLEASAAGLPIVSTAVGGIPHMINNNVDGILIQPGNIDAFVETTVALIRDVDRACNIGLAARRNAELYSWKTCALSLAQFYAFSEDER